MEYIKINENEMKVIKTETKEIEVDDLIAKCKELGIVEKVEIKEIIK